MLKTFYQTSDLRQQSFAKRLTHFYNHNKINENQSNSFFTKDFTLKPNNFKSFIFCFP